MGFWESTLSSSIGAFVGVIGAVLIAKWQTNKAYKMNNMPFYIRFNESQIYINRFNEKVDDILIYIETSERKHARILLSKLDFMELKEEIENTIKTLNPEMKEVDFKDFPKTLGKIAKDAPVAYYVHFNWLIFSMVIIYNLLLIECKNIVMDPPQSIKIGNVKSLSYRKIIKSHRKKYKMLKRKLNIRK